MASGFVDEGHASSSRWPGGSPCMRRCAGDGPDRFFFLVGWGVDRLVGWEDGSDGLLFGLGITSDELDVSSDGADALVTRGIDQIRILGAAGQIDSDDFHFV